MLDLFEWGMELLGLLNMSHSLLSINWIFFICYSLKPAMLNAFSFIKKSFKLNQSIVQSKILPLLHSSAQFTNSFAGLL